MQATSTPTEEKGEEIGTTKSFDGTNKFHTLHIVAYTVAAVLARQYSGWQIGLSGGFGSFMIGQVLSAFGCICHYLCLMEIWSAVPFSGGSYGLSRATLGFHLGFLDGCMEALIYVGHAALSAISLGIRIVTIFQSPPDQQSVFSLCFFVLALAVCVQNNVIVLRRSFMALAVISMIILLIYCLGMLKFVNFQENASLHRAEPASAADNWFLGGWKEWIVILPWTLQPYAGIRSFTLLTGMTENPKVTLPRAVVISFTIIILVNILVVFVFVSQPGGILHTANRKVPPMKAGWTLIFGTEDNPLASAQIAAILQMPVTFSRLLAYCIPASVMIHSMGRSNLMPSIMMVNHSKDATKAAVWCFLFGMGMVVIFYYYPTTLLFNLTVMATMITDCTFLYGYILLKTTYSTVPREFVSPFGMAGAIFAFLMYVLIFISAAFYQDDDYFGLKFFAGFLGILSIYYHFFARTSQTLNEEEDHVFFKMHVRNFNIAKKNSTKRRWYHILNMFDFHHKKKSNRIAVINYEMKSKRISGGGGSGGAVEEEKNSNHVSTVDVGSYSKSTTQGKSGSGPELLPETIAEGTEIAVEGGLGGAALKYVLTTSDCPAVDTALGGTAVGGGVGVLTGDLQTNSAKEGSKKDNWVNEDKQRQ